jgi:hypothetical protein
MSSADGVNWTYRFDRPLGIRGLAYGAASAKYVHVGQTAVGVNRLFYGSDLASWTEATVPASFTAPGGPTPTYSIDSMAGGPEGFVAVSQAGGTLSSADGITWTHYPSSTQRPHRVRYLNGKFYAVASNGIGSSFIGLYERGVSDTTWTTYAIPTTGQPSDVAYANGVYAVTELFTQKVWTSTDKINWIVSTAPSATNGLTSIVGNGADFIAVGPSAVATPSTNSALSATRVAGNLTWTANVIVTTGAYMVDVAVANGKTVTVGSAATTSNVTVNISGSSGGTVPNASLPTASGGTVSFSAIPNAGYIITAVGGNCGATFSGTTVTTGPVTATCFVSVSFGIAPVACTLDIDDDGAVLAHTDGLLILRRMLTLSAEGLRANAYNPMGNRLVAVDMAALIDPMIATKTLDIDGNGTVSAATDGLILLRALLGFSGTAVTNGALGSGTLSRGSWALIRPYLADVCGIANLAPLP